MKRMVITAAEEGGNSIEDRYDELASEIQDDFSYFADGADKLFRDGEHDRAIAILETFKSTLNQAIDSVSQSITSSDTDVEE